MLQFSVYCRWKNVRLLHYLCRKEHHTTPGDDRPRSQHSIPSGTVGLLFIGDVSFFPAATDLWTADTLMLAPSHRSHSDVFHVLVRGWFMKWVASCNDTEYWLVLYKCVNQCVLCSVLWTFWRYSRVSLTGTSIGQSSERHSLVTQCRKTVDIFWFLCFTKRNTSKAKRPIWLFPFSKMVVWGSFSQLTQLN